MDNAGQRTRTGGCDNCEAAVIARYRQTLEQERKQRQAAGIAAAKARGVRFGRPPIAAPENFGALVAAWENHTLPFDDLLKLCHMSETTFFRRLRQFRLECGLKSGL